MSKHVRRRVYLLATALLTAGALAQAALQRNGPVTLTVEASDNTVGPFGGTSTHLTVSHANGNLTLVSDLRQLDMGLRDKAFEEEFEVARFPNARLVIAESELVFPSSGSTISDTARGSFTLHGVTRQVVVTYRARRISASDYEITNATFAFDYTDFNLDRICKLGVCVDEDVTIRLPLLKLRDN